MATVADKLTIADFERLYGDRKPHYEYWFGEALQKAMPTWPHSVLQGIAVALLKEAGYKAGSELTLKISADFEPVPDVAASAGRMEGPYPTQPVDVVVEILSPEDSFQRLMRKCRIYAEWGIPVIVVLDPDGRAGWIWDNQLRTLTPARVITLNNANSITLERIFAELDASL